MSMQIASGAIAPFRLSSARRSARKTVKRGARANLAFSLLFVAYVIVMLFSLVWHGVQPSAEPDMTSGMQTML